VLDVLYDPPGRNPGEKPLKWILIDSAIVAGIAFVAALPAARTPTPEDIYVALRAFLYTLLVQLAVERGVKPVVKKREGGESSGGEP
jgi:predicted phosphoribosyltransferase